MTGKKTIALIIIPLVLALFFFLLPSLLTTPWAIRHKLAQFDRELPARISLGSCSLGWNQGLFCQDIRYTDPDKGIQIRADSLSGDKGLFALLFAPSYQGEIEVQQPVLTLPAAPPLNGSGGQAADDTFRQDTGTAWWERLSCIFHLRQGQIRIARAGAPAREAARDIELDGSLALGTIKYQVTFQTGLERQGHFRGEGFINLPTTSQSLLGDLVSQTRLEAKHVGISPFLNLLASSGYDAPQGNGVLNASILIATSGLRNITLEGGASLNNLSLSGAFLGPDRAAFDALSVKFKGRYQDILGWRLDGFSLASAPLRMEGRGQYNKQTAALKASGTFDLPLLAAQLPHLFGLSRQDGIREGVLGFFLDLSGAPGNLSIKIDCQSDNLVLSGNSQLFSEDRPFTLFAELGWQQEAFSVRNLRIASSFLEAQGSGNASTFTFRAAADLRQALEELESFLPPDLHGQGRLELTGSSQVSDEGDYQVDARLSLSDFALQRENTPLLMPGASSLRLTAQLPPGFWEEDRFSNLRLEGRFKPGSFSLESGGAGWQNGILHLPYAIKASLDLDQVNHLLWGIYRQKPPYRLEGLFSGKGAGEWTAGRLTLARLEGDIDRFALSRGGKAIWREARTHVLLGGGGQEKKRPVHVRDLVVSGNFKSFRDADKDRPLTIRGLLVNTAWRDFAAPQNTESGKPLAIRDLLVSKDWRYFIAPKQAALTLDRQRLELRHFGLNSAETAINGSLSLDLASPEDFTAEIQAESDAALLTAILQAAGWLDEDTVMRGRASSYLRTGAKASRSECNIRLKPLTLFQGKKKVFADTALSFKVMASHPETNKETIQIDSLTMHSAPLELEASGLMRRGAQPILELEGSVRPDAAFLSSLLPDALRQVRMTGKGRAPFLFTGPLRQPADLSRITLSTTLSLDTLRYKNIVLGRTELPLDMNRGKIQCTVKAPFSGGKISMQPQWRFSGPHPALTLAADTQVLTNVKVQQALLDDILAPLHPLFGILGQPEGPVSLRLSGFSLPMGPQKTGEPSFSAVIAAGGLSWQPGKALGELFEEIGLPSPLQLEKEDITCTVGKGRVFCSPIHLSAGGLTLPLEGSTGMDGILDYQIELPVTERLAQKLKLPFRPGLKARARISGSTAKPLAGRKAFFREAAALLRAKPLPQPRPTPAQETGDPQRQEKIAGNAGKRLSPAERTSIFSDIPFTIQDAQ